MRRVRVGKIVRAVGLQGLVGVAGSEGALARVGRVALRRGDEEPRWARVVEARPQGRLWVVRLEGLADRASAEALVGCEVLAAREDLGAPEEGAYYWGDLEGARVVTVTGDDVGVVTGLYATGAVDVLVVEGRRGEVLLPLAPYVEVDAAERRIVVDPPEGLLELGRSVGAADPSGEGGGREEEER